MIGLMQAKRAVSNVDLNRRETLNHIGNEFRGSRVYEFKNQWRFGLPIVCVVGRISMIYVRIIREGAKGGRVTRACPVTMLYLYGNCAVFLG